MKRRFTVALLILLIGAGVFFGYRYYTTVYLPDHRLEEAEEKQKELIESIRPSRQQPAETDHQKTEDGNREKNPLAEGQMVNRDIAAWIWIPDTTIDYPVAQAGDNDFYLHHGADGRYNYDLGCPFLDYRCERDFSGFNSIVYGHNIRGRRMFADLRLFADQDFFDAHPEGWLTLEDGMHRVNFIAYLTVPHDSPVYETVLITPEDHRKYLETMWSLARYTSPVEISELEENKKLKLLLLSTCTYEFHEARGVLVGVIDG